jgi:uncharacterized protein
MSRTQPSCALITGASQGLGRAFARECADRGMSLLLVALPGSGLPELCDSIASERGVSVEYLEADLTEPSSLDCLLAMIRSKELKVDLLVNNAGIGAVGLFLDRSVEYHDAVITLNALALVRLTRLLVTRLGDRGPARILNVASLGALFPMPTFAVYSATKSFVLNFSLALREELSGSVGVSVLCPNAIRTTPAVNGYIDKLGLIPRLACLTPERIARIAMNGAVRGKAVIIPGFVNRVAAAVSRFVPRTVVAKTISHFWGSYGESIEGTHDLYAPRASAGMADRPVL